MAPTYDQNNTLTGGDPNCIQTLPPQTYMWSGMPSLFIKLEQNNLWNEINFNLYANDPSNSTSIRRTLDVFVCPSNRRATTISTSTGLERDRPARAVRLPGQPWPPGTSRRPTTNCPDLTPGNADQNPYCWMYDNGMMYHEFDGQHGRHHGRNVHHDPVGESIYPFGTWSQAQTACVRTHDSADASIARSSPMAQPYWIYWASKHPGQVNFAYCDGTVRAMPLRSTRSR